MSDDLSFRSVSVTTAVLGPVVFSSVSLKALDVMAEGEPSSSVRRRQTDRQTPKQDVKVFFKNSVGPPAVKSYLPPQKRETAVCPSSSRYSTVDLWRGSTEGGGRGGFMSGGVGIEGASGKVTFKLLFPLFFSPNACFLSVLCGAKMKTKRSTSFTGEK